VCLVTSTNSTCVTSKYSVLHTTSILILSHCVWRLTRTVPLSPSHRVVYLARTVLLSSVLLLPGLSLTQCTRSTLFISSHTSQPDVFLYITPRLHNVLFIVVFVHRVARWRANLSITQCCVAPSNCTLILRNASLYYCPSQHFNDIHINTYVYSVTPVIVQDYNPVYTRVCIHTVFSCQVCLRKAGAPLSVKITVVLEELWVTDSSTQSSRAKATTSTTSFELSLESTSGQSTYQVCVR